MNDRSAANLRCPVCGYEMWAGEVKSPIDVSMLWFCPTDGHVLDRLDPLGAIEAEQRTEPETFDRFVERDDVLGVIHADVTDAD